MSFQTFFIPSLYWLPLSPIHFTWNIYMCTFIPMLCSYCTNPYTFLFQCFAPTPQIHVCMRITWLYGLQICQEDKVMMHIKCENLRSNITKIWRHAIKNPWKWKVRVASSSILEIPCRKQLKESIFKPCHEGMNRVLIIRLRVSYNINIT